MSLPRTQALRSSTFALPPLDETLSLPGLYDWHYKHSPDHALFVFEDGPGTVRTIQYREAGQGMNRASQYALWSVRSQYALRSVGSQPEVPQQSPLVVAILAISDTVTYFSVIVGMLRLGWTVFPISPRNSPEAIAALLSQTKSSHLFVSSDFVAISLANASLKMLPNGSDIPKHVMPVFDNLFPKNGPDPAFKFVPMPPIDMDAPAMILHSSGTTAYPSPVTWTHRSWIQFAKLPYYGEMDLTGVTIACHAVPMFHGMGIVQLNFAVSCGLVVSMFKPRSPPTMPNPVNTLHGALTTKSDLVAVVPAFIEAWSRNKQSVEALATQNMGIVYGGGPLSKEIGDYMAANGVKIFVNYASTQAAILSVFLPKQPEEDWEYFRFSPNREVHMIPDGHGAAEAVIVATPDFTPRKINTKVDGRDAYATSDLVVAHPTIPGLWKVFGRTDDQIMHSTGEKTNPGPLENILSRDPHIQAAVIFGRGQFHAGVIIQPKEPFAFDPSDPLKLASFRNLIWPSVETANTFAPSHSRIFKEMILVASPGKPFSYTPKGTARRLAVIADYEAEITALYKAAAESSQEDLVGPNWGTCSYLDILAFVRSVVQKTLTRTEFLSDNADIFSAGCDSLQATWIRNTLLRALRTDYPQVARSLSSNFVYDYPSISALSSCIVSSLLVDKLQVSSTDEVAGGGDTNGVASGPSKITELQALVDKYTGGLPTLASYSPDQATPEGEAFLLTGSTGSLGSCILARLLESSTVKRVFALARLSPSSSSTNNESVSLYDRHVAAFERSGLDVSLLQSPKVSFIVADLARPDLGLSPELLLEIKSSLTHIIHNAWRVDFKLSVSSLEPMIAGVRNLVDLALSCASVPKFVFISSVGVVRHATTAVPEVAFTSPALALGSGYSESKWVAERILDTVSQVTPLKATIVRSGQLTGGPSGAWNEAEWFPKLVKTGIFMKYIPDVDGDISWLSCSDAASALFDIAQSEQGARTAYYHLVHPRPTPWSQMIRHVSKILQLRVITYNQWFALLEDMYGMLFGSDTSYDSDINDEFTDMAPAFRLMSFFEAAADRLSDPSTEPLGVPRLDCQEILKVSQTLRDPALPSIDLDTVSKWIDNWTSSGFLDRSL